MTSLTNSHVVRWQWLRNQSSAQIHDVSPPKKINKEVATIHVFLGGAVRTMADLSHRLLAHDPLLRGERLGLRQRAL